MKTNLKFQKPLETWHQDVLNDDLWHGADGLIINTAALHEREFYFDIVRVSNVGNLFKMEASRRLTY